MSSDLMSAMGAAATGLRAQSVRIRISAENLANADSTASSSGSSYGCSSCSRAEVRSPSTG